MVNSFKRYLSKIPQPSPNLTFFYSAIAGLFSGYLYLYASWAPDFANRLQLTPSQAGVLTICFSGGSSVGGVAVGFIIDKFGTGMGSLVGGVLTFVVHMSLRYMYIHQISNLPLAALLQSFSGIACIAPEYAGIKCMSTNFEHMKGIATATVVGTFALSSVAMSSTIGVLYKNDVAGLLKCISLLNGAVLSMGYFFIVELPKNEIYEMIDTPEELDFEEPALKSRIAPTVNSENFSIDGGSSSLMSSPSQSHINYDTFGDDPNQGKKLTTPEFHETLVHYRSTSAILNESNNDDNVVYNSSRIGYFENLKTQIINFFDTLVFKIFVSRLFLLTLLSLACLVSVGQTYIFSVGYIVKTQFLNPNFDYGATSAQDYQNVQVAAFSFCNFIGRFFSGFLSDILAKNFSCQRLWGIIGCVILLFSAQSAMTVLNNVKHLWIVSSISGFAFGIIFGIFPSTVSDYYDPSVYSTVWGTVTTGPFFSNALLTKFFSHEIQSNGEWNDQLEAFVCTKGVDCYKNTFHLSQMFCILGLLTVLYTIHYKGNILKDRIF